MGDDRDDQPASDALAVNGDHDRDGRLSGVAELQQRVARLGLELQVERERVRALETRLNADLHSVGEAGPQPATHGHNSDATLRATLDRLWFVGGAELRTWRARSHVFGARPEDAGPATAWSMPSVREAIALALILAVAIVARVYDLADVPKGFQGDEATAGLLGRRIADEGWIGPYTTEMAGSTMGFLYLVAGSMAILPDDVFAIRLTSAALGVMTVAALYVLLRRNFGVPAAIAGAALLATSGWHIHFSRLGFPTGSWLPITLVALIALVEAIRTEDWRWWVGVGTLLGIGLYSYNSHLLLLGIVVPFVLVWLFGLPALVAGSGFALYVARPSFLTLLLFAAAVVWLLSSRRVQDRRLVGAAIAFLLPIVLVGSVLFRYIAEHHQAYFNYGNRVPITRTDGWAARDSSAEKIGFVADRYVEFWDRLCCHPQIDGVDATGVTALVPLPMVLLAAVGVGFGLRGRGRIAAALALIVAGAIPLISVSLVDFAMRRALILAPLLTMFAGIGIVGLARWARVQRPPARYPALALIVFISALSVYRSLDDYFGTTIESDAVHWVFANEMVVASQHLNELPDDTYVYFFSDRWPWSHEIRRFFAPEARGEDRGETFGDFGFGIESSRGRPVFLFLDAYVDQLAVAQARYPGGETVIGGDPADPDYLVYLPPPLGPDQHLPNESGPFATPTAIPTGHG